jgi:hypothetical protein
MSSTTQNRIHRTLSPTGFSARIVAALALAAVITSACSDSNRVTGPAALASIAVTQNATVAASSTLQMQAVGYDANGGVVSISPTWSIAASGGTISSTGLFSAGTVAGLFANTVVASVGSISGRASVTVTAGPLASITLDPTQLTLAVNTTRQFVAAGKDAGGNVVQFTPVWSVVNGGGTITSTGLFTSGAVSGTFSNTIRATSGNVFGSATMQVVAEPPSSVSLGAAAANGVMAGTTVTCVTGGIINADVTISPGTALTGFGPCVIMGVQHLGDPVAAQGQIDLTTAYNTLAGLPCPPANVIVADLGGTTKPAGVYCNASSIGVTGTVTLDGGGDVNATFVFQAGSTLTTAGSVVLINGAQAKNVYWQVGSSATLGTASHWQGNILALASISMVDNATLLGRALARNGAVTMGTNNVITQP